MVRCHGVRIARQLGREVLNSVTNALVITVLLTRTALVATAVNFAMQLWSHFRENRGISIVFAVLIAVD